MPKQNLEKFLLKAKNIHGDKYDYSNINYTNLASPITFICPIHGEVTCIAEKHLKKSGCPLCDKEIKEEYTEQSKKINKDSGVEVKYPDGTIRLFNSPEEASENIPFTSASIASYCARRSKGKDGYSFRWISQKAKLGKQNKRKGNHFELEVVHKLNDLGFNVVTSRSESKRTDDNKIDIYDVDGTLPINIQTKYTSNTPSYFTIREACSDTSKPFGIIWKKSVSGENSPGTVAIIPVEFFYDLLKLYKK